MAAKIKRLGVGVGWRLPAATAPLAAIIFVADILTPPDCVVSGLYVIVVLVSGRFARGRRLAAICAGCGALTVVAQVAAHRITLTSDLLLYVGAFNTFVSLLAIGLAGYLVARGQDSELALAQARTDLARAARAAVMGELTASIAHEVNQPIAGAVANANATLRWLGADPPNVEEALAAAGRIVRDGRRAADVVTRVRTMFTRGEAQRAPVQLNRLARETIELLAGEAVRHGAAIRADLAADLPEVWADPVQVQQVILNLIMNGIEATHAAPGARQVTVSTRAAPDGGVCAEVADTGTGLPADTSTLFDAFVTTKPGGTGMGLAISRSIVEAHRGELAAVPRPGGGALFRFTLPAGRPG